MNFNRILSALLAAVLSLGVLVSCASGDAGKTEDTTPAVTEETTPAVTEPEVETTTGREGVKDAVPADLRYDGEQINVIYRDTDWWDMTGTDSSGDIINDSIWMRNLKVEERFGFKLNLCPTQSTGAGNVANELKNLVFSGSTEYDVICSTANTTVTQSLYPYLYELSSVEYLDITSPWWRTSAIEELSFDGKTYRYLMGDNTVNDYLKCGVLYYNKDIYTAVTQADADEMYKLVLEGTWTWDALAELTTQAYADLNGDGAQNMGDQFGFLIPSTVAEATPHFIFSCDIVTHSRNEDGSISLAAMNNERIVSTIDKINQVVRQTSGSFVCDKAIDYAQEYFAENVALFYAGRLTNVRSDAMREMESDYGILPLPKLDAEQEKYVTYIHNSATITCVPKTVPDSRISMVGAFLEGWAAEAYRTVLTPFIETAMKMKYSRDALSGQVIDIIFEDPTISFVDMYNNNVNGIYNSVIASNVNNGTNNFASAVAKMLSSSQKGLDLYLKQIKDADR